MKLSLKKQKQKPKQLYNPLSLSAPYWGLFTNTMLNYKLGFPGSSRGEEPPASVGEWFDPWVGKIPWRWKWQPSSVFLPKKKSLEKRSLPDGLQWGHKELDMTEHARNYKLMTRNNSRQDTMFWAYAKKKKLEIQKKKCTFWMYVCVCVCVCVCVYQWWDEAAEREVQKGS